MEEKERFLESKFVLDGVKGFYTVVNIMRKNCRLYRNSSCNESLVSLDSYEFIDGSLNLKDGFKGKTIRVNVERECSTFTFEFPSQPLFDLYEVVWNMKMSKIVHECLKIWVYSAKAAELNLIPSWSQLNLEKQIESLDHMSILIRKISQDQSFTYEVHLLYKDKNLYTEDKNLIETLQSSKEFTDFFCLQNAKFEEENAKSEEENARSKEEEKNAKSKIDNAKSKEENANSKEITRIIILHEPIENLNFNQFETIISEQPYNFYQNIKIPEKNKYVSINDQIKFYLKSSFINQCFVSPSIMKIKEKQISNLVTISDSPLAGSDYSFGLKNPNELIDSVEIFDSVLDNQDLQTWDISGNRQNIFYNYAYFRPLRHKSLVRIYGIRTIEANLQLVTEPIDATLKSQFPIKNLKNKIKIIKQIVKLLIYCRNRKFYYIGIDLNRIYIDRSGNIKFLLNLSDQPEKNLASPEEKFLGYSQKSENFRLGLIISEIYFSDIETKPSTHTNWLTSNIPIFSEASQREHQKFVQIINELTNPIPSFRLSYESLLHNFS